MSETSGFKNWLHEAWESGLAAGVLCALSLLILIWYSLFFIAAPLFMVVPVALGYRYARPTKYSGRPAAVFSGIRSGIKPVLPTAIMLLTGSILLFLVLSREKYDLLALLLGVPWTGMIIAEGAFGGLLKGLALPPEQTLPPPPAAPQPPVEAAK